MLTNQYFGPVRQNDTFRVNFVLQDADGAPLQFSELGGATLTWRSSLTNGGAAVDEVAATLIEIDSGGDAAAQVLVPTDVVGFFWHELEMVLAGETTTMATGWYSIEPEIALVSG